MLLRISLIVAILAGLGAGVVSYLEVSDKIPALTKQRDDEHTEADEKASSNQPVHRWLPSLASAGAAAPWSGSRYLPSPGIT